MNFLLKTFREGRKQENENKLSELVSIRGTLHRCINPKSFSSAPLRATLIEIPPSLSKHNVETQNFQEESPFPSWVITVGKIRVSISPTTNIHPKPFHNESTSKPTTATQQLRGIKEDEKYILTLVTDAEGGQIELKLNDERSFLRWQTALCDALSDTICGVAVRYTSSGRISTEKIARALTYCSQLSRPTLPSIRRTSQILGYRRQLSDLQLKLSLFLQQQHPSSSSSIASSILYSEHDSLAGSTFNIICTLLPLPHTLVIPLTETPSSPPHTNPLFLTFVVISPAFSPYHSRRISPLSHISS